MIVKTIIIDEENRRIIIKNEKIRKIYNMEEELSKTIDEALDECFK